MVYKKEYSQKLTDFFSRFIGSEAEKMPFMIDFCLENKISLVDAYKWLKDEPEFREAYRLTKKIVESGLVNRALKNQYNATFAVFTAKNLLGWKEKTESKVELNGTISLADLAKKRKEEKEKTA